MLDNIHEEIEYWQAHDEDVCLNLIFKHELNTVEPKDLGKWFRSELKRRHIGEYQ